MCNRCVVVLLLLFGACSALVAQFEGRIEMKITSYEDGKPQSMNMTLFVKNDLLVSDMEGEKNGGKIIIRGDKQLMWIVNDEHKMYLEMSLKENKVKKELPSSEKSKFNMRKTGGTKTILGYECEEWVAEEGDEVTTMWGTTKLGNIYQGIAKAMGNLGELGSGAGVERWQKEILDKNFFPLKVEIKEKGRTTSSQEITKVESKTLPASMFAPPEGYQKQSLDFDINKMMQHMQQENEKD
jgi:hypothetical protein